MNCPKCGNAQVRIISEVDTHTDIKGYGCCKGALGALLFGPVGWLCGLCGMGEGTTRTVTKTLWVCENCGNRWR